MNTIGREFPPTKKKAESTSPLLLRCAALGVPGELRNLRVVFKQRRSLNARLLLLAFLTRTSQSLLPRKHLLRLPLQAPLRWLRSGFLGGERGRRTPPFGWGSPIGRLAFPFGGLCSLCHSPKERAARGALVHEDRPQSEASLPTEWHLPAEIIRPICQATV